MDIPIGGKNYSAQTLPLILEFVNIVNNINPDFKQTLTDDSNGDETVKLLLKVRKIAWRINSIHSSSLGLHPIVYFYSQEGRHKIASFFATLSFILQLEQKNTFSDFILVRPQFEEVLVQYDYLIQQINRKYRSALGSYQHIKDFYFAVIDQLKAGKSKDAAITEIIKLSKFNYLTLQTETSPVTSSDFSTERKSAIYIREALAKAPKCKICGGLIHRNSITIDHIRRKEDGGIGDIDNGQITHPYCNSTIKN